MIRMTTIVPEVAFLLSQPLINVAGHRLVACVEISLSRLSPLPARLPYQHSFASTEGGVGSRGRSSIDGNPRRQAKDPFVEQINNDASRNSGLNLSLRYATVVPYSVLH